MLSRKLKVRREALKEINIDDSTFEVYFVSANILQQTSLKYSLNEYAMVGFFAFSINIDTLINSKCLIYFVTINFHLKGGK